jgi:hypothetical protein
VFDTTGVSRHPHRAVRRRHLLTPVLLGLGAIVLVTAIGHGRAHDGAQEPDGALKPGQFRWSPEQATSGPVVIVVSLDDQMAHVYRGGVLIGESTVSTGRRGYPTPTGVFQILQKKIEHYSNLYDDAPMPYMQRLTWGGLALHAGRLPGYPASHGCIRLPLEFAERLFAVTTASTTVVIADRHVDPSETHGSGLILDTVEFTEAPDGGSSVEPPAGLVWRPEEARTGPLGIVISGADQAVYAYRDGVLIGRAGLVPKGPRRALVPAAFVRLDDSDAGPDAAAPRGGRWMALPLEAGASPLASAERAALPREFVAKLSGLLTPGTVLIVTDRPVTTETMTDRNFTVIATDDSPTSGARPE